MPERESNSQERGEKNKVKLRSFSVFIYETTLQKAPSWFFMFLGFKWPSVQASERFEVFKLQAELTFLIITRRPIYLDLLFFYFQQALGSSIYLLLSIIGHFWKGGWWMKTKRSPLGHTARLRLSEQPHLTHCTHCLG